MGIFKGKSVEEAIETGLEELNLTRETAEIKVLDEGSKGVFGLGGKKAEVSIEPKLNEEDRASNFLEGLFEILNIPVTVEKIKEDEKLVFNLVSTKSSLLIGHRGEILDAIQTLTGAVLNIGNEEYKRVVVDSENYRQKRNETLESLANKLADKAVKFGKKVTLEPMNPYERRVIHSTLSSRENIKTESVGVEPNRYIVIIPDNLKPYSREERGNNRYKNGRKDNRNGSKSGFKSEMIKTTKKTSGYGTYLGNSFKND